MLIFFLLVTCTGRFRYSCHLIIQRYVNRVCAPMPLTEQNKGGEQCTGRSKITICTQPVLSPLHTEKSDVQASEHTIPQKIFFAFYLSVFCFGVDPLETVPYDHMHFVDTISLPSVNFSHTKPHVQHALLIPYIISSLFNYMDRNIASHYF